MSDDLSLVSTDQLLNALKERFDNFIFVANAPHSDKEDSTHFKYEGNWLVLLGMLKRVGHKMQQDMDEDGYEVDSANA